MTTLKKTLKVPWAEFKTLALLSLKEKYPSLIEDKASLMKHNYAEPDSECYEIPDYIEIPID